MTASDLPCQCLERSDQVGLKDTRTGTRAENDTALLTQERPIYAIYDAGRHECTLKLYVGLVDIHHTAFTLGLNIHPLLTIPPSSGAQCWGLRATQQALEGSVGFQFSCLWCTKPHTYVFVVPSLLLSLFRMDFACRSCLQCNG